MAIESGHVHRLVPISAYPRDDGVTVVKSRCEGSPPRLLGAEPAEQCSLEEQREYRKAEDGSDVCVGVRYRFGSMWFAPLDLLRVGSGLPVEECPDCNGDRMILPCLRCQGAGVVGVGGAPLEMPNLRVKV